MDKPTLAILGLGSRSTLFYLKELNNIYHTKKGGYSTCPFLLLNADFDQINPLLPNPSSALIDSVGKYLNEIEKLGSKHVLIPNITLHETIDRLKITPAIIHPVSLSISKIKENKWTKIILFGSLYSMESSYIASNFEKNGIEVILPSTKDRLLIDEVRKQLYSGTETEELIQKYNLLLENYASEYPVVISCTELSILKPNKTSLNILDMAQVQITKAIELVD